MHLCGFSFITSYFFYQLGVYIFQYFPLTSIQSIQHSIADKIGAIRCWAGFQSPTVRATSIRQGL